MSLADDREPVHRIYLEVTEGEAIDLVSGFVPTTVKAILLGVLDQANEDQRRAARPLPKKKSKTMMREEAVSAGSSDCRTASK